MSLSEVSVNRPITIAVITALLVGISLFMIPSLAVEQMPDVDPPMMIVYTEYDGASPLEVEQSVTEILEQQLSNVSGLEDLSSTSSEESSVVMLEFGYDKDMTEATNDIRDSLDQVKNSLPDDAESPVIIQFDMNSQAIMKLIMTGDESPDTLKRMAEDEIEPQLERIEGVSSADVSGGETRAIRVDLSLNRLEAYGLTADDVSDALTARNLQMSGGSIDSNGLEYDVRVDERYDSVEEIARTVVATLSAADESSSVNRSNVVRLEDVADVYDGAEDLDSLYYIDGRSAISLAVYKESDTNSVTVADAVLDALPEINKSLPSGMKVELLYNRTTYIKSVLHKVYQSAWQGIVLAMLILLLFLRNLRSTIIIGISIPVSIAITLMAMYFFHITLNMMSLTGLILGLGMIVDSSIVILENIHQYRERGAKLRASSLLGSQEMLNSIVASTLTTLSVFIPMIIWRNGLDMFGEFFSDMIFTVVISLTVSFFTAVTLVPAMCSRLVKLYTHKQRPIKNRTIKKFDAVGERWLTGLESGYRKALEFVLRNKALVLTLVIVLLLLSLAKFSVMGFSLMPRSESDDRIEVSITMPSGSTLETTEAVLTQFSQIVQDEVKGYTHLTMSAGGGSSFRASGDNEGTLGIMLPSLKDQVMSSSEIQAILRKHINDFPDADITISSGRSFGEDDPIDVVVYSDSLDMAEEVADEIKELIKQNIPQAVDPVTDLDEGTPEYRLVIDRDRAASYGLTVSEIANAVNTLVDGDTPTTYWDNADELDVIVQLKEDDRTDLEDLGSVFILSSSGDEVALSNLVTYKEGTGPLEINRENETRTVNVTADLEEGAAASDVQPMIASMLKEKLVLPDGVTYDFEGDQMNLAEMIPTVITIAVVALLMIFAVMASQFESLVDPFIIFFSIPLLFIGVVGIYIVTGAVMSVFSLIGMVVLMGIVVNNGIVMVDYMNLLRKRGYSLHYAVVEGARSRLRPILMTSLTTILGMVPMAFSPGEGTEMIKPIGQTIVGGLTASTFITLFVTPAIYTLLNRKRKNKKKNKKESSPKDPQQEAIA